MKITAILTVCLFLILSAQAVKADSHSALMKALKSAQAEMLMGEGEHDKVAIIFVQPKDHESTVRNAESLDTIYFVTEHKNWTKWCEGGELRNSGLLLIFKTDQTGESLRLQKYLHKVGFWGGVLSFKLEELSNIDFKKAYRTIKENGDAPGYAYPIAQIAITKLLGPPWNQQAIFNIKNEWNNKCSQYVVDVSADPYELAYIYPSDVQCYFDMDSLGMEQSIDEDHGAIGCMNDEATGPEQDCP